MSGAGTRSLRRDVIGGLGVRAVGVICIFASVTVTAAMLGPAEYGPYGAALSVAMFLATLIPMGTDRVLARDLSALPSPTESGYRIGRTLRVVLGNVVVCLICLTVLMLIFYFLNLQAAIRAMVPAAVLMLPLTLIYLRQWAALSLLGTGRSLLFEQIAFPIGFLTVQAIFLRAGISLSAATACAAHVIVLLCLLLVGMCLNPFRGMAGSIRQGFRDRAPGNRRRQLIAGFPFAVVSFGTIAYQTSMPVVTAITTGYESAACYAIAVSFAALPGIPLGVLNLSMIPECVRLRNQGRHSDADRVLRLTTTFTSASSLLIATALWLTSDVVGWMLGHDYSRISSVLPWMLAAAVTDSLTGPTVPVMQTMKLEALYSKLMCLYVPLQILLTAVMGICFDLSGIVISVFAGRVIWNVVILSVIHQQLGVLMLPTFQIRHFRVRHHGPVMMET